MKELASKLKSQAVALRYLATTVGEDLGRISDNVSSAASDIVNSVKETDVLVSKHYEQNSELVEQLTGVNKEMFASHVKFEKSLGVMVDGYTLHRNDVVELGDKSAVLIDGLGRSVKPMNKAVNFSEKKVRVISVDLLEDVETEALEVAKKI